MYYSVKYVPTKLQGQPKPRQSPNKLLPGEGPEFPNKRKNFVLKLLSSPVVILRSNKNCG